MPEEQRTADAKAMLETYGQKADFVDFSALEQINISSGTDGDKGQAPVTRE